MSVLRKIGKCGNSKALVIPPTMLEELGWDIGQEVEMTVEGGRLIVQKEPQPAFKQKLFGGKTDG